MPQHQKGEKTTGRTNSHKLILLGEDDRDDEEFLKEIFTSIDDSFSLVVINNGKHVIDHLKNLEDDQFPCLIVLDYNMPELNGAEILKELQGHDRFENIPKVIWSTSRSETYKNICLELGAREYFIKPTKVSELVEIVRHMFSFC